MRRCLLLGGGVVRRCLLLGGGVVRRCLLLGGGVVCRCLLLGGGVMCRCLLKAILQWLSRHGANQEEVVFNVTLDHEPQAT